MFIKQKNKSHNPKPIIGLYADPDGFGHLERALAIATQAQGYFTILTTKKANIPDYIPRVNLPSCPLNTNRFQATIKANRNRYQDVYLAKLKDWLDEAQPELLIIDSSSTVAKIAQEKCIPYVMIRLAGQHNDKAYLQAFNNAKSIICPYHCLLEADSTPNWLRARSQYYPSLKQTNYFYTDMGMSTKLLAGKQPILLIIAEESSLRKKHITVRSQDILNTARALPDWQIEIIGQKCPAIIKPILPKNINFHGWVKNPESIIDRASIIVGSASDCSLTIAASSAKPLICIPQQRALNEQYEKAMRLAHLKACVVCSDWPENWQHSIAKAEEIGGLVSALHQENSANHLAKYLLNLGTERSLKKCIIKKEEVKRPYMSTTTSHFKLRIAEKDKNKKNIYKKPRLDSLIFSA